MSHFGFINYILLNLNSINSFYFYYNKRNNNRVNSKSIIKLRHTSTTELLTSSLIDYTKVTIHSTTLHLNIVHILSRNSFPTPILRLHVIRRTYAPRVKGGILKHLYTMILSRIRQLPQLWFILIDIIFLSFSFYYCLK